MRFLQWYYRSKFRLFLTSALILIFYNEFLSFKLQPFLWKQIYCRYENCTRILLVADPQIIGETFDSAFYNPLAIYDSDRFLKHTFRESFKFANPDIIIFLGDLFDEGSLATIDEFSRYFARFNDIFEINKDIMKIYIPGDNDIGGENGELVTPAKINRFKKHFKTQEQYLYQNFLIYEVNRITREFPKPLPPNSLDNTRRIVVSHMSLLFYHDDFSDRILRYIQPHIIFSAHSHRSMFIKYPQQFTSFTRASPLNNDKDNRYSIQKFDLSDVAQKSFLEIVVPTCSFRMGERNVGYGLAVIDGNDLFYTVLWSSERFTQLFIYIAFLLFWFILLCIKCLYPCILFILSRKKRQVTYLKL